MPINENRKLFFTYSFSYKLSNKWISCSLTLQFSLFFISPHLPTFLLTQETQTIDMATRLFSVSVPEQQPQPRTKRTPFSAVAASLLLQISRLPTSQTTLETIHEEETTVNVDGASKLIDSASVSFGQTNGSTCFSQIKKHLSTNSNNIRCA